MVGNVSKTDVASIARKRKLTGELQGSPGNLTYGFLSGQGASPTGRLHGGLTTGPSGG